MLCALYNTYCTCRTYRTYCTYCTCFTVLRICLLGYCHRRAAPSSVSAVATRSRSIRASVFFLHVTWILQGFNFTKIWTSCLRNQINVDGQLLPFLLMVKALEKRIKNTWTRRMPGEGFRLHFAEPNEQTHISAILLVWQSGLYDQ